MKKHRRHFGVVDIRVADVWLRFDENIKTMHTGN